MTLCIPYLILEPIMSKLTTTFWVAASANKRDTTETCALKKRLIKTPVPVSVILGKTLINVQEFMSLAPGDVLPLDSKCGGELSFVVGQKEKFKCRPGLAGKHMAVQVTRVCSNKGDDSDE
jgi:flagellar motor switch protein FliM